MSRILPISLLILAVLAVSFFVYGSTQKESEPVVTMVTEPLTSLPIFDRTHTLLTGADALESTELLVAEIAQGTEASKEGEEVVLSIDSELQDYIYNAIRDLANEKGYRGGAGVVMDLRTGELMALASYSTEATTTNKATAGLFVPGSIVKPFIAMAALSEGSIDPEKEILSTGSITLTDNNGVERVFNDWKRHGYVDMREALGVSSNVYFYAIGGGYEDQPGLGIQKITEYLKLFGVGEMTGVGAVAEGDGQTPTPQWKEEVYGDEWRLGDTYLTSIGQHGYQVTPLQMTRAIGAIATNGKLLVPTVLRGDGAEAQYEHVSLAAEDFAVVQEGMHYAVLNGTASGLFMDDLTLAAKTGTAEADSERKHIHSWIIGYFPYDEPRYAFTFMFDYGPWGEETGAVSLAQKIFTWMKDNKTAYFK